MIKKTIRINLAFFIIFTALHVFAQENSADSSSAQKLEIEGLWENGGRFIEFSIKDRTKDFLDMRVVLKPYYRFVYENIGEFKTSIETLPDSKSQFYLRVSYPYVKKTVVFPVCLEKGFFFTSFYKKVKQNDDETNIISKDKKGLLDGFWIEQGSPDGILLYPNDAPESIDAYFFNGDDYIRFRYWLDDLEYNNKKVYVEGNDGIKYEFPRLLKRGELVYSCVTNTGSVLRNYETGKYTAFSDSNAENTKGFFLSFKPLGAGPGTHAAPDTYPKAQFSVLENLPLYIMDDGKVFALGSPFLIRSDVKDLDSEIERHNAKRRPPPEPSIPNEDL